MTTFPDYNLHSDLALVEVARPFELAPHIDTVCLPRPGQDFRGQVCTATGWGKDRWAGREETVRSSSLGLARFEPD